MEKRISTESNKSNSSLKRILTFYQQVNIIRNKLLFDSEKEVIKYNSDLKRPVFSFNFKNKKKSPYMTKKVLNQNINNQYSKECDYDKPNKSLFSYVSKNNLSPSCQQINRLDTEGSQYIKTSNFDYNAETNEDNIITLHKIYSESRKSVDNKYTEFFSKLKKLFNKEFKLDDKINEVKKANNDITSRTVLNKKRKNNNSNSNNLKNNHTLNEGFLSPFNLNINYNDCLSNKSNKSNKRNKSKYQI